MKILTDQDSSKLPLLTKNNTPLKWCESFRHHLYLSFWSKGDSPPLCLCDTITVTPESGTDPNIKYDPLMTGKSYGESGSILEDLIYRSSHQHPLFKKDNASVYGHIEEATRGSIYMTTIKPFYRKKDGRAS